MKKLSTTLDFFTAPAYLYEKTTMMKNHKRQYRELDDETKQKISASQRGKMKSESHRRHISQAMEKYWQTVPHRPTSGETV